MEIGKPFNQCTVDEYYQIIDNHKKYKDFNSLGLYRSLIEHEQLSLEEKIRVRDYANKTLYKTFEFLQLKDPDTYFAVSTLGDELSEVEFRQFWKDIVANQQKILSDKNIKHRNFGTYSKHDCGRADCPLNGLMIKKGSSLSWNMMKFHTDKDKSTAEKKAQHRKSERKNKQQIIRRALGDGDEI
ncbi:hypothetical protein COR50_04515 [Chitinophaga caeni]|uniref:Uncharacterized protein n=1 Tax=Chitinophaga caeni TaxID=2029983 RepID=A0A291QRF3_9BACT|nr:hypothetical protein [Chitinophaga caeni]ATL46495.1 hypothetical protein COR50_04515 [Chitinophaga caeni]